MFEIEVLEVGFVIHARLEAIIHRMKLNNCVIDAIEARLVYEIETVLITYTRPGRPEHFIGAANRPQYGLHVA